MGIIKAKKIPIYKGYLVVIVSGDMQFVNKHVEFSEESDLYAHALHAVYKEEDEGFYIILNNENPTKLTHGVIVHEILHVVNFILESRGVLADRSNDEADAYLAQWVGDFVFKTIKSVKL